MTFELPKDIQRHVRNHVLKCVIPFAVLEITLIFILAFLGHMLFSTSVIGFRILCYFLVLIVPFFITKFPLKLIDRSWYGEIIQVDIKSRTVVYGSTRLNLRNEQAVLLMIKTPEREVLHKEALICDQAPQRPGVQDGELIKSKLENHATEYQVGDTVYHFYGLKQLLVIHKNKYEFSRCLICSQNNAGDRDICWHCGHSLIKNPPDIKY